MKLIYFAALLLAMQWTVVRVTGGNGHQRKPTTYITYTASDKELQSAMDVKPQVACPPFVTISNIRVKKKIPWSVRYLRKKTKHGLRRTQMNLRISTCEEETSAARTTTDLMTIKEAETPIPPNTFTTSLLQRTGGRFIAPVPSPQCCTKTSKYRVRVTEIVKYVHQDKPQCPIKAVRYVLRNGITLCSNPEDAWAKHVIKVLDGTTI